MTHVPIKLRLASGKGLLPELGPLASRCSPANAVPEGMVLPSSCSPTSFASKRAAEDDCGQEMEIKECVVGLPGVSGGCGRPDQLNEEERQTVEARGGDSRIYLGRANGA